MRINLYFLPIFLIAFSFSTCLYGQSLFEMAVTLDSLYTTLTKDSTSSKTFFDELEKMYKLDDAIAPADIKLDFASNRYLSEKVNNAFRMLSRVDDQIKDHIQELEDQRTSLFASAILLAQESCKPKERERGGQQLSLFEEVEVTPATEENKPCNIEKELRDLVRDLTLDNLTALRKKSNNTELANSLIIIEGDIFRIELEISEKKAGSESIFQLSAEAGNGLYINASASMANAPLPPIIFQQQGSGSLSSSIIDGTSKWIAERMREELSIAFFDRFEYWVEGKNIKILFPNTFSALKSSVTTDYALMIQIFKTAFEKDLKQLPFNLGGFLEEELAYKDTLKNIERNILLATTTIYKIKREIKTNEELYDYFSKKLSITQNQVELEQKGGGIKKASDEYYATYNVAEETLSSIEKEHQTLLKKLDDAQNYLAKSDAIVQEAFKVLKYVLFTLKAIDILSDGEHPTSLLSYLNENIDELFPQSGNVKPALLVLDVISRSMISIDQKKNTVWLKGKDLSRLKNSAQLRDFYFGLIYQEIKQSLRREKSFLEEEINSIVQDEILESGIVDQARPSNQYVRAWINRYLFHGAPYGDIKTMDEFLSSRENEYLIDEQGKKQYREEAGPLYEKAIALSAGNTYDDGNYSKLRSLIDVALTMPKTKALLGEDPDYLKKATDYIYTIPYEVADSLYENVDVAKLTVVQKDTVVKVSKNILNLKLENRLPYDNQFEKDLIDSAADFMGHSFNWNCRQERIELLKDSIKNIAYKVFLEYARRDSAKIINEAIEGNFAIQKKYIQLQRINNYEKFIDTLLLSNKRNFGDIINGFVQFASRMDNIHAEFNRLKKEGNANFGSQEFIYLMKSSLDALNQIYRIALPNDQSTLNTVQGLTINLLDAYSAVLEKDYDAIVMNIIPVADSLLELSFQQKVKELKLKAAIKDTLGRSDIVNKLLDHKIDLSNKSKKEIKKELTRKEKRELRKVFKKPLVRQEKNEWGLQLDKLLEEKENKIRKMHEIFKYGAFLAAVVESKDADEIKRAIQAVALPAGSYSIKRRAFRNISLNSYPGLTGGMELASNNTNNNWAPNFGFTAPIGLAYSWGYKTKIDGYKYFTKPAYRRRVEHSTKLEGNRFLSGHSGTLYLPLIDLGAVVLFRLDNNGDALPEDIGFQQIFSPGIMYAHGLPDLPISIMGGMQVSPQLRKIDEQKANSFRFNVSIVVDLPLANFHTQMKRR